MTWRPSVAARDVRLAELQVESPQATPRTHIEVMKATGANVAALSIRRLQQLRQRVPFVNWFIRYGVPMASASLFIADIVRLQRPSTSSFVHSFAYHCLLGVVVHCCNQGR